jgi:hypothetical protein
MRTVVVHQPDFLPYLGFFHRLVYADIYVALDHIQFGQEGWTHRDKIKTVKGEAWLSLSVRKCPLKTPIKDVELSPNVHWRDDNLNLMSHNYRSASFYRSIWQELQRIYRAPVGRLAPFNLMLLDRLCDWLAIRVERVCSSEIAPAGRRSEMVAQLVKSVGGTHYLSGQGARAYHDQTPFDDCGIEVVWQNFHHPVYPQQFGGFLPNLSAIDALFNCGPDQTARMLRGA